MNQYRCTHIEIWKDELGRIFTVETVCHVIVGTWLQSQHPCDSVDSATHLAPLHWPCKDTMMPGICWPAKSTPLRETSNSFPTTQLLELHAAF